MTTPSTTAANGNFVIVADYGHVIEVHEDEVYNDRAFTWQHADEMQAEADSDPDSVVKYGVYELTAVSR